MADQPVTETPEAPLPPEEILSMRQILKQAADLVDSGEVESVTVYMNRRDETYQTLQSSTPSRLLEAGLLLELAVTRLGFMDERAVRAIVAAEMEK